MARRDNLYHRLADSIGPVTAGTLLLVIAGTLAAPLFTHWVRLTNIFEKVAFLPDEVWAGQVWRLISYPWVITGGQNVILNILFSIWAIVIFMAAVEGAWGSRRLLTRMAILIVGPALVVTLIYKVFPHVQGDLGPQSLITAIVVAYAVELRGNTIRILLFPMPLGGDQLIMFEGAMILVLIIISGTILPFVLPIVSFFWAVAWFRLGWGVNVRRSWLLFRKGRVEAQMSKARKRSNLRVVSSRDDDDDNTRYLH